MKKFLTILISVVVIVTVIYFSFIYFVTFSEGVRSGELIKISKKGVLFKTWEGEISQGISGAQIFSFSVEDKHKDVIIDLEKYQGRYVKLNYIERYKTLFWLGDSKYFVTKVTEEQSPHFKLN
ncbi:MAG: 6-phosphogluconate dehydrogenase [Flavobacteriia bacterium]|nr:6-phosphogluconate dehydrogenase [Flavobacteriia bacterium]OIP46849.1 MAG: 6-phosphogluconate dehydrogenase [Flavobacteriaceae bacterium CG2_30_31_66]PIV96341.1 MAG: 6-phosphogluconate dehydrogenase [Flavobacteriaceae bacterium CG17_big_fil_post_rev_8_21_14_2_50_31_13]PIX13216.1 MAG: 6-phosphogluconate dehydrogenase [Flavobacteriaceae bacterium CG_4_8_14_3_um_filter_31_8]PIY15536.1 MAG: 6-phosphogluconate dehydrogenase [Flavobacteriaceae bacterium CG_4_10_14_3_um_filter_31_253]PIZ11720.1 MA